MLEKDFIEYWVKLGHSERGFKDLDRSLEVAYSLAPVMEAFVIDDAGVFAYMFAPDFEGGTSLVELFFYVKPERRGSIRLVKRFIDHAEKIAIEKKCESIKIGANFGIKDSGFIKLLCRFGYHPDTMAKGL